MKYTSIIETIGRTAHIRINKLYPDAVEVWMKLERSNPGGSIKDRIALSMVEDAEHRGILKKGTVIIEPTSGNTGIGLAMVAAVKGYRIIMVMPESMSIERRYIMAAYGAEFDLTAREKGMKGAIERAENLAKELPDAWIPMQFENEANINAHRKYTAPEIINDFPDGLDYMITGVGTGGHITGCAEVLKKKWPKIKVIAVEPELSPVISGGNPGPHPIQGIGAGFIPKNLYTHLLDETVSVSKEDAYLYTVRIAKEEGIFVGVSTGAALAAVASKIPEMKKGSRVLTFCYDTGERYLSVEGLFG
jgi:cysteine synthase A